MKILLTGVTGFLGQNLEPVLSKDYEVVGYGSEPWDLRKQSLVEYIVQKIRPDVIVHAAGSVGGIGANKENPGKFMYENLIMGTNLIHQAMKYEGSKVCFIGNGLYHIQKHTPVPFKEEELWNGYPEETNAPYGIAKKTLMRLVEAYHEQYDFNGVQSSTR